MFSIGEFSKITGLSIKTIRFYHEKEILIPSCVDSNTGYRYYDHSNVEKARIIIYFRNIEFSINEIKEILDNYNDQTDILDYLEQHKQTIEAKIRKYKNIVISLDNIISNEREAIAAIENSSFEIEEKSLEAILIAGVRMQGKYSDCGKGFTRIGKNFGRYICSKPLCLYYDDEYRPEDANFEACIPIRRSKEVEGISVRQLPAGRCISLLHKGPYDELGRSYAKILEYVNIKKYEIILPTREVYLKGPGIIFKGNPKNYLTEIQMMIK
ncbi:MAG: MerR family transcriptional regulator [Planctomycetes bacterium]|nr:MerR family transcriptional regulator [Planctomycetota bacterium]